MNGFLHKFDLAVNRGWLHLAAGLMWSAVGMMLALFAARWIRALDWLTLSAILLAGLVLALLIYFFGFSKLARKNILRINAMQRDRICIFAFQEWRSYPLVVFMIFLGVYLRLYSPVPKPVLSILYLGIGLSLFASSFPYYGHSIHSLSTSHKERS